MIEKLWDPNYRLRRTGEVKEGNISQGISKLGTFSNSIYTMSELECHKDCIKVDSVVNSTSIWGNIGGSKSKGNYSKLSVNKNRNIHTISELIRKVKSGEIYKLELRANDLHNVYVAKTDIDKSKIIHDHLWSFLNGESKGSRFNGYVEVSHIHSIFSETTHKNIIFIVKNSRKSLTYKPITSNCCFPEFLKPSVMRSCGKAFEYLNNKLPIVIPDSGDLALGIGTSISHGDVLYNSIYVKINGNEVP